MPDPKKAQEAKEVYESKRVPYLTDPTSVGMRLDPERWEKIEAKMRGKAPGTAAKIRAKDGKVRKALKIKGKKKRRKPILSAAEEALLETEKRKRRRGGRAIPEPKRTIEQVEMRRLTPEQQEFERLSKESMILSGMMTGDVAIHADPHVIYKHTAKEPALLVTDLAEKRRVQLTRDYPSFKGWRLSFATDEQLAMAERLKEEGRRERLVREQMYMEQVTAEKQAQIERMMMRQAQEAQQQQRRPGGR